VHAQGREPVDSLLFIEQINNTNMTDHQTKESSLESKSYHFAGIDVGSEELVLVVRKNGKPFDPQKYGNTRAEHARMIKKLTKLSGIIVCMEATGVYHFDLAIALHDAGLKVMVINPKVSHNFAKVLMQNSKTDDVDANTLAVYAERMDFLPWTRPPKENIALRCFSRRINALTDQKAATKNHLHALLASEETPKAVLRDANLAITQLEKRIANLTDDALTLIGKHAELTRVLALLTGIKGIANTSAIALMGELLLLPPELSHRQWVKFAGLDPRAFESGKSVHKKTRISKAGNHHMRAALYMPALSAKQHDLYVNAYYQHLLDNGKLPLQAICAIMRKLLHAIHGMLKHDKPFDNTRFYAIPNVAE
jgi:transposase